MRTAVTRSNDRSTVSVQYDRQATAKAVIVESIRLDLGAAPAGRYRLTLDIRDLNSDRRSTTTREIVVVTR